jgi:hypothetical protein
MDTNSELDMPEGRRFLFGFCIPSQVKLLFSIVSTLAWIGGSLYWIAFLGGGYTFFQNVVIILLVFLVFCLSNAILWVID